MTVTTVKASVSAIQARKREALLQTPTDRAMAILRATMQRKRYVCFHCSTDIGNLDHCPRCGAYEMRSVAYAK